MIRVALADDHAMVRDGLRGVIEASDRAEVCLETRSGEELLRGLSRCAVDACVIDLSMPGIGGLQAIAGVARVQPGVGVVAVSFHPPAQYALRAIAAGAGAYLPKESPGAELMRAIEAVAAGGRYLTEEVQALLLQGVRDGRAPHDALSDRELVVLVGLAEGRPLADLARELGLSAKTLSTYRARMLAKLGLRSNAELIQYAAANNLIG